MTNISRPPKWLGLIQTGALCAALAACSDSSPIAAPQPSFYDHLASADAHVDPAAARDMISVYRRNNGLSTLSIDPELMRRAQARADAMARADKVDRESRLNEAGKGAGVENVSAGYHTLAEAFSGWRQSPHHNANMLAPRARAMGIATAYNPASKYKVFWALELAD